MSISSIRLSRPLGWFALFSPCLPEFFACAHMYSLFSVFFFTLKALYLLGF